VVLVTKATRVTLVTEVPLGQLVLLVPTALTARPVQLALPAKTDLRAPLALSALPVKTVVAERSVSLL
jgi:hypothetical protein